MDSPAREELVLEVHVKLSCAGENNRWHSNRHFILFQKRSSSRGTQFECGPYRGPAIADSDSLEEELPREVQTM